MIIILERKSQGFTEGNGHFKDSSLSGRSFKSFSWFQLVVPTN